MKKKLPRSSFIWATAIAIGVIVWMLSDEFWPTNYEELPETIQENRKPDSKTGMPSPIKVSAIRVKNEQIPLKIRGSGVTKTLFEIHIVARRQGVVKKINVSEGSWVNSKDVLLELDKGTLDADIEAARADRLAATAVYENTKKRYKKDGELEVQLRSAIADFTATRKNYEIAKSLVKQGVQTELALSQKRALLRASESRLFELKNISKELELTKSYAQLKAIDSNILSLEQQLNFTKILAPQYGWLEELNVETGEFVDENRSVARILGLQSLIIDVPVPQTSISRIDIGNPVEINFPGIGTRKGVVDKIAAAANEATRTFNVEIELNNSDGVFRAGMSAEVAIIIGDVMAFKVSPAHLNVRADGQLTVKTINSKERVKIIPVELVRTSGNFAYISGVVDGVIMLTTGQAFLSNNETASYSLVKGEN